MSKRRVKEKKKGGFARKGTDQNEKHTTPKSSRSMLLHLQHQQHQQEISAVKAKVYQLNRGVVMPIPVSKTCVHSAPSIT